MCTYNFASSRRKNLLSSALFVFCMILSSLLLLLPSIAFAFSTSPAADPAQNVAQAGISVVRIVVTYIATGNTPSPKGTVLPLPGGSKLQCTGLGALVSSSTPSGDATAKNVWVLTDGSLLNPDKMTCGTSNPGIPATAQVQLSEIQVFVSNEYTNTKPNNALIVTLAVKTGEVTCENTANCNQGLALFGFSSPALQPYINLAQSASTGTAQEQGIELSNSSPSTASTPPTGPNAQQSLSPQAVPLASTLIEPGMPIVDTSGSLVGMHLSAATASASLSNITKLMVNVPALNTHPANLLHDNWDSGIQAYYVARNYAAARSDFQKATAANPQFAAGIAFAALAAAKLQPGGSAGNAPSVTSPSISADRGINAFLSSPLLLLTIVALIVLVVLLTAVSILRRRRSLTQFKQEEEAARQRAEKEAQYIASMESQRRQVQTSQFSSASTGMNVTNAINGPIPTSPVQTSMQPTPIHDFPCPRCGNLVPASAKYCSSCSVRLSRSTSGKLVVLPELPRVPVTDSASSNPAVKARLRDLWEEAGE